MVKTQRIVISAGVDGHPLSIILDEIDGFILNFKI